MPSPPAWIGARRGSAVAWASAWLVLASFVVAGGVVAAHPAQRWDDFTAAPISPLEQAAPGTGNGGTDEAPSSGEHLASTSGNGRWQFWGAAVDEFETRPLVGRGAGSYEAWWAEHGTVSYFTRRAHSFYLQTLGELGVLGGLLLLALLGAATAAVVRALRRTRGDERITVAALAAVCAGFGFAAAIDWMWELTVVSVLAMAALALVAGPAAAPRDEPPADGSRTGRRARWALRAPFVVLALGLVIAQAIPFAANAKIERESQAGGHRQPFSGAEGRAGRPGHPALGGVAQPSARPGPPRAGRVGRGSVGHPRSDRRCSLRLAAVAGLLQPAT